MSQSNLQVLLHAGELQKIVHTIQQSNGCFVAGCLFGLWRNSLKQPVVQFVTGPGKGFKNNTKVEDIFNNEYNRKCKEIMFNKHAMLKLGYWCCCSDSEKSQVREYFGDSPPNVILFISLSEGELHAEFCLRKDNEGDNGPLCKEDVLDGNSSFRLYHPLTEAIDKAGAKYPSRSVQENELRSLWTLIEKLPSRIEVRDAETRKEQWYSNEAGVKVLQSLVQRMNGAYIQVEMNRDATTHNLQFNLDRGYCLDFPPDFPNSMPIFSDPRGNIIRLKFYYLEDGDICRTIIDAIRPYVQPGSGR